MSRESNLDQIVTRWMDDGPDVAPERFVWAALEQVERTPQRGSWRVALENTPMFLKFGVPVLGAAAAIILGVFLYGSLNPAQSGSPSESPAAVASPDATATPDRTPDPCDREVAEVPAPGTLDVMWCVPRGTDRVILPFTIRAPEAWIDQVYTGGGVLYFRPPGEPAILVALTGPDTVDEWLTELSATAAFEVSDPVRVEIAGGEAVVVDVRRSATANQTGAPPLISSSDVPLQMQEGNAARVWILEGQGEAVAFATTTSEAEFDEWADAVSESVQSLEWNATP